MTRFYRKDRFRSRKYFDKFPMRADQAHAIGYYIVGSYGWWDVNFSDGRFWDYLNKLIYRVSRSLRIVPSKVTAEIVSIWIVSKLRLRND